MGHIPIYDNYNSLSGKVSAIGLPLILKSAHGVISMEVVIG